MYSMTNRTVAIAKPMTTKQKNTVSIVMSIEGIIIIKRLMVMLTIQ